jgi:carboxymethylenebutenolidase
VVGSTAALQLLAACGATPADAPNDPVVQEETPEQAAASVTVSEDELITETVMYPGAEGAELMGYLARPEGSEPRPGIVVIQEWWGLNEHIRDITRRFAQQGFVALAPDLYGGVTTSEPDEAQRLVMELDMVAAVQEIGQAMDYLLAQDYVGSEEIGVVGYCLGGGLALETGRVYEQVGAVVAYYGRPLEPAQAADINAPVLGLYGAEDQGIPVEEVQAMEDALNEADVTNEFFIYDDAGHAFFNDTRDSYNEAAASDAWPRTLAWFEQYL